MHAEQAGFATSSVHRRSLSHHGCKPHVSVPRQAALLFPPQERIRAKLANSAPPAPPADAAAGAAAAEVALPDDPDTLSARLAESEGEVDRWGRALVLDAIAHTSASCYCWARASLLSGVPPDAHIGMLLVGSLACPPGCCLAHTPPCRLQAALAMEEERRRQWADENIRRRTDYM